MGRKAYRVSNVGPGAMAILLGVTVGSILALTVAGDIASGNVSMDTVYRGAGAVGFSAGGPAVAYAIV